MVSLRCVPKILARLPPGTFWPLFRVRPVRVPGVAIQGELDARAFAFVQFGTQGNQQALDGRELERTCCRIGNDGYERLAVLAVHV
jgi:hypothetical protein